MADFDPDLFVDKTEDADEGESDDAVEGAAVDAWSDQEMEKKISNRMPTDKINAEDRLRDFIRPREVTGNVEFTKIGQETVALKNGFSYTQNPDGSMVVRDTGGNTFVVAQDNSLTVIRPNGQVETYQPEKVLYKDGGSVGYNYPPEAGFNLVRKHRGIGRDADTGVEISGGGFAFNTTMVRGRPGSFSYQDLPQKITHNRKK